MYVFTFNIYESYLVAENEAACHTCLVNKLKISFKMLKVIFVVVNFGDKYNGVFLGIGVFTNIVEDVSKSHFEQF